MSWSRNGGKGRKPSHRHRGEWLRNLNLFLCLRKLENRQIEKKAHTLALLYVFRNYKIFLQVLLWSFLSFLYGFNLIFGPQNMTDFSVDLFKASIKLDKTSSTSSFSLEIVKANFGHKLVAASHLLTSHSRWTSWTSHHIWHSAS